MLLPRAGIIRAATLLSKIGRRKIVGSSSTAAPITPTTATVVPSGEVTIVEVGPRDGLQNEAGIVSTDDKVRLIRMLTDAGCRKIEAGSFVSSKYVPNMANTRQVMEQIADLRKQQQGLLQVSCLVPTLKYFEQAIQVRPDEIAIFASASEAFSQKNINCSIQESLERFQDVMDAAQRHHHLPVRGYLSCVIACPYQGKTPPSSVAKVTEQLLAMGCYEVSLGDTIGVGTVASTNAMLDAALSAVGDSNSDVLAVHFHDTYGQALTNIFTSLQRGIRTVDSSVAGLGGCPYARGASGNVATEDVVYLLDGLGIQTGIDLDRLVDAGEFISNVLGRSSGSKAGTAILAKRKRDGQ